MKSAAWHGERPFGLRFGASDAPGLAACAAVALLMVFPGVAGALAGLLALAGIAVAARPATIGAAERQFAWLCLLLPAAYLFNMALKSWALNLLDRPMHLAYAALLALAIARCGLRPAALFWSSVAGALAAGAIAWSEIHLAGQERVFGLGGRWNAVPFGNFSLLLGCFALAGGLALQRPDARLPLVAGTLGFACGLYASMMSGSRGGWLALPFLVVIASHASARIRTRHRALLASALIAVALASFAASDSVRERVALGVQEVSAFLREPMSAAAMDNSSGIRLAMWRWGIERFHEQPLTGIGYANFAELRAQAVAAGELPAHFDSLANLHNELVSHLAFGGLPSAAALLSFWILAWRFFANRLEDADDERARYFAALGLMTVLGTTLFSMTEGLFGTRPGTYALVLLLALPAGALCHLERRRASGGSA